jgi:hypothetical protein
MNFHISSLETTWICYQLCRSQLPLGKLSFFSLNSSPVIVICSHLNLLTSALIRFVCFGSYLAKLGNIRVGCMFALAKSLVEKLHVNDKEAAVHCVLSLKLSVSSTLFRRVLIFSRVSQCISLSRGDIIYYACTNRLQHTINCFWSGLNLDVVNKTLDDAQFFVKQGQESSIHFVTMQRTVRRLMGTTDLDLSTCFPQFVHLFLFLIMTCRNTAPFFRVGSSNGEASSCVHDEFFAVVDIFEVRVINFDGLLCCGWQRFVSDNWFQR